jgi:hypothetical protein
MSCGKLDFLIDLGQRWVYRLHLINFSFLITSKLQELRSVCDLGVYLTAKIYGNRAETASVMTVIHSIGNQLVAYNNNNSFPAQINVTCQSKNYFRSFLWVGQARLTKFPIPLQNRLVHEIPI